MSTSIWPALGSGGGGGGGGSTFTLTISGPTTLPTQVGNLFVVANSSGGGYTVTLPDAVANAGFQVTIKNYSAGAGSVHLITVAAQNGQTIDEFTTDQLSQDDQAATYTPVAGEWYRSG